MRRTLLAIGVVVFAIGGSGGAAARATAASQTPATAVPAASASKASPRKRQRVAKPKRIVAPGVTGGTPATSARTPGGPPLGTPNGLTVPIPSPKR